MSNIISKYLVHFSLCLLLKGDFLQGNFSLIYSLTMESSRLDRVALGSVSKLIIFEEIESQDKFMILYKGTSFAIISNVRRSSRIPVQGCIRFDRQIVPAHCNLTDFQIGWVLTSV